MANDAESSREKAIPLFIFLFMLPMILVALVLSICAWALARAGASVGVVKLFSFPASLLMSNYLSIIPYIIGNILYELISGRRGYTLAELPDFTLYPIWGRIVSVFWNWGIQDFSVQVPIWQIALYQIAVYLVVGRIILEWWTLGILFLAGRIQNNSNPIT